MQEATTTEGRRSERPALGDDLDLRKAIWIASYPKSGNTWVRVFIHNLLRQLRGELDPQDINALGVSTPWEVQARHFAERLGRPAAEASLLEVAAARPLVQADILRSCARPVLLKTHNAVANVGGHPTINFEATLAAVYVLRNPLDVAVSYAHHAGLLSCEIVEMMQNPEAGHGTDAGNAFEFMGSWSFHVASWMSVAHRPVLLLRYEDMRRAPERAFGRLASFLRLEPSAGQLRRAIEHSSFEEMTRQEATRGFTERPAAAERFFRKGAVGQWREALTREEIAAVVATHAPMMQRFGYLPEDCGAAL
jgi:hypothetical protein